MLSARVGYMRGVRMVEEYHRGGTDGTLGYYRSGWYSIRSRGWARVAVGHSWGLQMVATLCLERGSVRVCAADAGVQGLLVSSTRKCRASTSPASGTLVERPVRIGLFP